MLLWKFRRDCRGLVAFLDFVQSYFSNSWFKIVLLWKLKRGWRGLVGFSDFFILKFMVSRIQMQLVIWKLSHERVKAHHTIFVSAPLMTPHFFRPHLFSSGHCSCVLKCIYSNLGIAMLFNMVWFCLKYMFFWKIKGY